MSRRVVVRPLAKEDLAEQARYIAQDSVVAGLRFLDAAESAFDRLKSMNEVGRRRAFLHPELAHVRSWPIPGFEKHVIFYRAAEGVVDCAARAPSGEGPRKDLRTGRPVAQGSEAWVSLSFEGNSASRSRSG